MKVVGRTDEGYLVQISESEIGICLGLGPYPNYGDTTLAWQRATGLAENQYIKTGTVIDVRAAHAYLETLRDNQTKARGCADVLRQLADMITSGLPKVVIPPAEPIENVGEAPK
jgi:hypothetical protein